MSKKSNFPLHKEGQIELLYFGQKMLRFLKMGKNQIFEKKFFDRFFRKNILIVFTGFDGLGLDDAVSLFRDKVGSDLASGERGSDR